MCRTLRIATKLICFAYSNLPNNCGVGGQINGGAENLWSEGIQINGGWKILEHLASVESQCGAVVILKRSQK